MAIFDISDHIEVETCKNESPPSSIDLKRQFSEFTLKPEQIGDTEASTSSLFSSIAARLFFLMLLFADIAWGIYSLCLLPLISLLHVLTGYKVALLKKKVSKCWLNIKRAFICGISLFVAIFSPALGTMFACTYFLMYDKNGIEEVVPVALQDQFREFFAP